MFRIGVTRDFLKPDGSIGFGDIGLSKFDAAPAVQWEFLRDNTRELSAQQVRDYDGLLVLGPRVTPATLGGADRLLVVARFGVGYDNVDVPACTENGVILTITPDGVRRPVAAAVMTFVLALTHRLLEKDRLTRQGLWAEKLDYMGQGVTGRTLGVVGLGNIGREVFMLAAPFGMEHLGCDPLVKPEQVRDLGVEVVDLETLLRRSDYVAICCALTDQSRHLINARALAQMKPTAYLINVARGGVVDQKALTKALQEGRIAGAGLDVFDPEPIDSSDPLLRLDNVIVTPHAICWTDECFTGNGTSACQSLIDVSQGRVPMHVVNRDALSHPKLKAKLQ